MKKVFEELKERGLLYQTTNEEYLKQLLNSDTPAVIYEGTDPTADSLHIGHCMPFLVLRRLQRAGHKIVLLVGGATACIGDPTGKSTMRQMLSPQQIQSNIDKIKNTLKIFLDFDGENPAILVNNADWFNSYNFVDFMREIGVHFNINKMLANEIYANRLKEGGLTMFELSYMLMQSYDFVHLNKEYGCNIQWGGSDQWANVVGGVELIRKLNFQNGTDIQLVGATNPILATPEGEKMGKTVNGAIWIDKDRISAYDFYQGVYQTPDACVEMMLALATDLPMDQIREMIKNDIVGTKKFLAYEVTKLVRGEQDAIAARDITAGLFGGQSNTDNAPTFELEKSNLPILLADLLVNSKIVASKSEARRMCEQGGISLDSVKQNDFNLKLDIADFKDNQMLIKKGKKQFIKVVIK